MGPEDGYMYTLPTYLIDVWPILLKSVSALKVQSDRLVACNYHLATLKCPCIYDGFFSFSRR